MHYQCLNSTNIVEFTQQQSHSAKPNTSVHWSLKASDLFAVQPLLQAHTKTVSVRLAKGSSTIASTVFESMCSHAQRFFFDSNGTSNNHSTMKPNISMNKPHVPLRTLLLSGEWNEVNYDISNDRFNVPPNAICVITRNSSVLHFSFSSQTSVNLPAPHPQKQHQQ